MKRIKELCMLLALTGISQAALAALPVTSGLVMNLDADNISPSMTGANGEVSVWPDEIASANDAVQPNLDNCPLLTQANPDFKGHSTVAFDGYNDWMSLNNNLVNVGSFTMFAVAKYNATTNQYLVTGQSDGGANRIRFAYNASSFAWRSGSSGEYRHTPNNNVNLFGSNSSAEFSLNGELVATYENTSTETPGAFGLGSYGRGSKDFMNGDIATFILYNRKLTQAEMDQMESYLMTKYMVNVSNPMPAEGDVGVGDPQDDVMVTFQWDAAPNPMDPTKVDPAIAKQYLYVSGGNTDPNMFKVAEINVTDYDNLTTTFGPVALEYDTTYSWQVVEALSDGHGGALAEDDPNNYYSDVWTFTSVLSVPVVTIQPESARRDAGDSVEFTTEFTSIYPVEVTWYKDGEAVVLDSRKTVVADETSTTLTILDLLDSDQGEYYCVLSGGGDTTSDSAVLAFKKLLASYDFEQNLNDENGLNNGTAVGVVSYAEGIVGGYAVQTANAEGYIQFTTDAYPKAGFGNGLDQFTYSFWVKPSAAHTNEGRIFGGFNEGQYTGVQVGVRGDGALTFYMRSDSGTFAQFITAADTVPDDQWSHVALTYSGSSLAFYVNGSMIGQQSANKMTNFSAWEYPMVCMAKNLRGVIDEYYSGMLDDLEIYNYPMDEYGVADIYIGVTGKDVCIESLRPSAVVDINGDCSVDVKDFSEIAEKWMDCGLYPACIN